jgi:hypothetical protein
MANDFDPKDPPPPDYGHNPLAEYAQVPVGISAMAVGQFLMAGLLTVTFFFAPTVVKSWTVSEWAIALYPVAVFAASGLGMAMRSGWGWWLTCAIYFYVFFNIPVGLVLWTTQEQQTFRIFDQLLMAGLAIFLLTYLNRPEILRFVRFGSKDGRAPQWMRISPVFVGMLGAGVRLIIELMRN